MRRSPCLLAFLVMSAYVALASTALAAPRLFTVTTGRGVICEIDPVAATEIQSFHTVGTGYHPGLAFNGTELFYTDETIPVIKVFLTDGTLLRDLPKPGSPAAGGGLGVSKTSLYVVGDFDGTITAIDPLDGTVQGSFFVPGSKEALTYAGSRGTMFVRVGDAAQLAEVKPDGTVVHTIDIPLNIAGLAFSSSANRLFAVVGGHLYAFDPDTGALEPNYPVDVYGTDGYRVAKTGAAAADESEPPVCGDGSVNAAGEDCDDGNLEDGDGCTASCKIERCGDGIVQPARGEECELPSTPGCDAACHRVEICSNMVDDDGDGLTDCEDGDCPPCLPIEKDPGIIRFGAPAAGHDLLVIHGSLSPGEILDVAGESTGILLTNADGTIYSAELPGGSLRTRSSTFFAFRDRSALVARRGIWKIDVHRRRRGGYTFRLKAYGDLSAATRPLMTVQWHLGGTVFMNNSVWQQTRHGWKLDLPGE
jgi:cysteine-rich repeat protein